MRILRVWIALAVAVTGLAVEPTATSPRIFIEPQNGFESYIAAAIIRKQVPVVVTQNKEDAKFVLTGMVQSERESTGGKIARCAFMHCLGMDGTQTATVELVGAAGEVLWAYNVRKLGATAYQSSAEAIAKHLKEFLETKPKKEPKK